MLGQEEGCEHREKKAPGTEPSSSAVKTRHGAEECRPQRKQHDRHIVVDLGRGDFHDLTVFDERTLSGCPAV